MTYFDTKAIFSASVVLLLAGCPGDDTADTGGNDDTTTTGADAETGVTPPPAGTTTGIPTAETSSGAGAESTTSEGEDTTDGGETTEGTDSGSTDGSDSTDSTDSTGEESESSGSTGVPGDPCVGTEVLLYEQTPMAGAKTGAPGGNGTGGIIRSADDFEVDAADQCWCVTRVVLDGFYVDTALSGDLEIGFYDDAPGVPLNPPLALESGVPMDTDGVFDYTLATPVVLPADTYWLSAMPEIPDVNAGIWFWTPATTMAGSPWALESTFVQFVPACMDWSGGSLCFPPGPMSDVAFELHGVVGGDSCM